MKSTTIRLKVSDFYDTGNGYCECVIDLLPAFAINYTELSINGVYHLEGSHYELDLKNSKLIITYDYQSFIEWAKENNNVLYIYYFDIRDYSLLFPKIQNRNIAKRLGSYYEEAEKCFDNSAWLSYALMCAAIFEGMLFSKYNKADTFENLIKYAFNSGDIDKVTCDTMTLTRNTRNLVHANNYIKPYITRIKAMDIRVVVDKLIKEFKY